MFKNVLLYKIDSKWQCSLDELEQALQQQKFVTPNLSQELALGWVPPRGVEQGLLVESVAGQWIICLRQETKSVPASVVKQQANQQAMQIEQATGRRPGKKELRDLKQQIRHSLLPNAFAKVTNLTIWLDLTEHLMLVDATNYAKADNALSLLTKALPGFSVQLLQTVTSAQVAMANWLLNYQVGNGFVIEQDCELKANNLEQKSTVKYNKHSLNISEIKQHIQQGKLPTKLALNWRDKVSFVLTDNLVLQRVKFAQDLYSDYGQILAEERFDADVTIATAELSELIADLIANLDGIESKH